ncbi:MAG TPA: class I SAM-dependent RNA methyltransferase [Ktedonobacterales bacterium]|jgi:23S rRNA (uracil1939-C5)-methyltransferase
MATDSEDEASAAAGPVVELELNDLAYGGDAVGRHEGRAIFVTGGLPGELVRARLTRERANYARAALVEVLRPSPDRVAPRYPDLAESGGFQWQHLSYPAQLTWKTRITRQLLIRVGHFAQPTVRPMLGMPPGADPWRYRTVAQFAVGADGAIGFRRAASHDVLDMPACPIVHPRLDALYQAVRAWLLARWGAEAGHYVERFTLRVAASDPTAPGVHRTPLLPGAIPPLPQPPSVPPPATDAAHAAESGNSHAPPPGQSAGLLSLEVRPGGAFDAAGGPRAIGEELLAAVPGLAGVVTLGLPGGRGRMVVGQDYLYDRVFDRVFRISAGSFFQVNAAQTPVLVEQALLAGHARPSDHVLDGYSGVGLFSLFFAGRAAQVTAIESQASAVADARASAEINHIANVATYEGVLERSLGSLVRRGEPVDVALVDPPRSGCHPRALAALRDLAPRAFLYVSCDPSTLARDLHLFCVDRYRLVSVQPVDLFPHTAHIESVALCERVRG